MVPNDGAQNEPWSTRGYVLRPFFWPEGERRMMIADGWFSLAEHSRRTGIAEQKWQKWCRQGDHRVAVPQHLQVRSRTDVPEGFEK